MTRKGRFATSVLAVFALALGVATIAQAEPPQFHFEKYPTAFSGTQVGTGVVLKSEGGSVECENGSFSGEAVETSTTLTGVHAYSNCSAFGFLSATVNSTGCHTTWHLTNERTAVDEIACSGSGTGIDITAGTCKVTIPPQGDLVHIVFENTTIFEPKLTMEIDAEITITNLAYNVTQDGFLCPFSGTGKRTDGQVKERFTVEDVTVF